MRFLESVAKYHLDKYGESLRSKVFVFPNKRSGLFFHKYLSELAGKAIWAPKTMTMDSLAAVIAGDQPSDRLTLILTLHKVFTRVTGFTEGLEEFYPWGEIMLNDFDEIDKQGVKAEDIFRNIFDLKEIDARFEYLTPEQKELIMRFWSEFKSARTSLDKSNFSEIWKKLLQVYISFNATLDENGEAYPGKIYRSASGNALNYAGQNTVPDHVFVGFNELSETEKRIMTAFRKEGKASFFWDVANYYLEDDTQEAGLFLRELVRKFPTPEDFEHKDNLLSETKKVRIVSAPQHISQAKLAGTSLEAFAVEGENTAIILPDESLLIPLLQSIPEDSGLFNVTMGFPIRNTPLPGLVEALLALQEKKSLHPVLKFHHREVMMLLRHPYLRFPAGYRSEKIEKITSGNRIYVDAEDLYGNELADLIFQPSENGIPTLVYLQDIFHFIFHRAKEENSGEPLSLEYLYHFYKNLKRLTEVLEENNEEPSIKILRRLLREITNSIRVPFTGEPLQGIQIMGLMESRCLDFDNVILLSANEGTLPGIDIRPSFIPYSIRAGFGLPVIEQQDARYAYLFYRLLHQANNVLITYNNLFDKGGEKSRFLRQISYELYKGKVSEEILVQEVWQGSDKFIRIERNPDIMEILSHYTEESAGPVKRFTPAALNSFLECRLQFYFKYVACIYEQDEVSEDLESQKFGLILHTAMELLYKGHVDREMTSNDLKMLKKAIPEAIDQAFWIEIAKKPKSGKYPFDGQMLIIRDMIRKYMERIVDYDMSIAPFRILELESKEKEELISRIAVRSGDKKYTVRIGGKIDRIDEKQGTTRIIDYKTGADSRTFSGLEELFDPEVEKRKKAVFQLMTYCWLYDQNNGKNRIVSPGLYLLRSIFNVDFDERLELKVGRSEGVPVSDFKEYSTDFEEKLTELVKDIFNPEMPFTQTEIEGKCMYCTYKKICNR